MKKQNRQDKNKNLSCREYREMIVPFLENRLDNKEKRFFMKHIDHCTGCKEELKIQYLVREGLSRLEKGKNFDFHKDFDYKVKQEKSDGNKIYVMQNMVNMLSVVSVIGVIVCLIISIFK